MADSNLGQEMSGKINNKVMKWWQWKMEIISNENWGRATDRKETLANIGFSDGKMFKKTTGKTSQIQVFNKEKANKFRNKFRNKLWVF